MENILVLSGLVTLSVASLFKYLASAREINLLKLEIISLKTAIATLEQENTELKSKNHQMHVKIDDLSKDGFYPLND